MKEVWEKDNNCRYALGFTGAKTLYCIGINPSIATPSNDDPTMKRAKKIAHFNDYDGFVMLNIYPQISTNPSCLNLSCNSEYHKENLRNFAKFIPDGATIWAAWGNLIRKRPYLIDCLKDINSKVLCEKRITWVKLGCLTKKETPRHPSRAKDGLKFDTFDFNAYLKDK